jgi:hypothetical protein
MGVEAILATKSFERLVPGAIRCDQCVFRQTETTAAQVALLVLFEALYEIIIVYYYVL